MANIEDVCKKAIMAVAIDFGTTFTGLAFSPIDSKDIKKTEVHLWEDYQGNAQKKTPTCLLLDSDKQFKAFGYDAEYEYLELTNNEEKNHYYFDKFKMKLHHAQDINKHLMLEDKNGKKMPAIDVFSLSLNYLKKKIVGILEKSGLITSEKEIQYVLTVPAIWTPSSKQFMREAATQAGLISEKSQNRLLIALEPEAAAIYCRDLPMNQFLDNKIPGDASCGDALAREGTVFMVVDSGGGTVDIAVLTRDSDNKLHEVHQATGGPWGGILFEQEFEKRLGETFGNSVVEKFKRENPKYWFKFMSKIQSAKREERYYGGKDSRVEITKAFRKTFWPEYKRLKDVNPTLDSGGLYFSEDRECMCLSSNFIKHLFNVSATSIIDHMKDLVGTLVKKNVNLKVIFLVGGFSKCKYIQDQIRLYFNNDFRVLVPTDPVSVVMKGAIMFCLKPDIIETRISRATYGYATCVEFDPEIHDSKKKVFYDDVAYCRDTFERVVKINEPMEYGKTRKSYANPVRANQKQILLTFYQTDEYDATYIDEPHVKPVGTAITVTSPDISKGLDRRIEVSVRFGETEFKVSAIDIESGSSATANIILS